MPSMYAHQKFGNDVLERLPQEVSKRLLVHEDVFHIGLQGPDIFFYYHPLSWGEIPRYGNRLHESHGHRFFGEAAERLRTLPEKTKEQRENKEASRVYLCGVLCHYMLDSTCHGFIEETAASGITSHAELEGDYDRHLIAAQGRDPVREVVTAQIHPSRAAAEAIAVFYPEVTADIVEQALVSCVKFQRLLLCRSDFKRNFFYAALRLLGKYDSLHPHIMNKEPDPACEEAEKRLDVLYQEALPKAASAIAELEAEGEENQDWEEKAARFFAKSPELDRDFGGGI